ncbi:MAG: hypothetical protein ACTSXX_09980 [Candidatus Baldrarchaeia archaeon]
MKISKNALYKDYLFYQEGKGFVSLKNQKKRYYMSPKKVRWFSVGENARLYDAKDLVKISLEEFKELTKDMMLVS